MRQLNKKVWPARCRGNIPMIDTGQPYVSKYKWCCENIGHCGRDWFYFDSGSNNVTNFAFKREEDYLTFKLRWSAKNGHV